MRITGSLATVAILVAVVACGGSAASVAPVSSSPSVAPTATPAPTIDGAALAEAVVAEFAADPFIAHVDQVGTVTSGGITAQVSGSIDVNGDDLRYLAQVSREDTDTELEFEVVVLGDDVWVRLGDKTTRTTRSAMPEQVASLGRGYRIVDDRSTLTYASTEMIDGRDLHHLTAPAGAVEYSDSNTTGYYDVFDLYVLADGTPVLVKGTFTARNDDGSEGTGTTEMRFSNVGGPISIEAPTQ